VKTSIKKEMCECAIENYTEQIDRYKE